MSFWTAIVVIAGIIALTEIIKSKHRSQAGITVDHATGEDKLIARNDPALKREVEELRERVKVLERIATEDGGSRRLSAEIESLRENKEKAR